jgi:hypothetical protein
MNQRILLSAIVATVLLFVSATASAALYVEPKLTQSPYNLKLYVMGGGNMVGLCKTVSCSDPGDKAFTCAVLTGDTTGVDKNDVPNCVSACGACAVDLHGLVNPSCC